MCSQLFQNVNISLDLCTAVSWGLWAAAKAFRGRFVEGSKKNKNWGKGNRFSEEAPRGRQEPSREPASDPPVGILYGTLIILLLEPSSEFAIKEYSMGKYV